MRIRRVVAATRTLARGSVAALVLLGASACDDVTGPSDDFGADLYFFNADGMITDQDCPTLWAGQTIDVGTVCVSVDNGTEIVTVTYETVDGWALEEFHFWIGTDLVAMPQTQSGHPKIGLFPYKAEGLASLTVYTFEIPFSELGTVEDVCESGLQVAAHAVVVNGDQEETAWGAGDRFVDRGTWATWFPITCDEVPPPAGSETAFAYGDDLSICFIGTDFDGQTFSRWGWTNGPLSESTSAYEFDIYAAAGKCDLSKGTLVGSLSVVFDGADANVEYVVDGGSGYGLQEVHLYVGTEVLPRNNGKYTVAPGQYPHVAENLGGVSTYDYLYEVCGGDPCPSDVYLIAHAVVSGF